MKPTYYLLEAGDRGENYKRITDFDNRKLWILDRGGKWRFVSPVYPDDAFNKNTWSNWKKTPLTEEEVFAILL